MWPRIRTGLLVLAAGITFVACAGHGAAILPPDARPGWLEVYGARVYARPDTQFPMKADALRVAFEVAAKYWGTKPDAIAGWAVIQRTFDPWQAGDQWVWGISFMNIKRLDFATPRPDCPEFVFIHEWGHAGASILDHEDPRFADGLILGALHEAGLCKA